MILDCNSPFKSYKMTNHKHKIKSIDEYNSAMKRIDSLMRQGEDMSNKDAAELKALALSAQAYEKALYEIPVPKTIQGILELEMYRRNLKQKDLAKLLNVGQAKLSQILSNKRDPDIAILKAAHEKLGIDGNILLRCA